MCRYPSSSSPELSSELMFPPTCTSTYSSWSSRLLPRERESSGIAVCVWERESVRECMCVLWDAMCVCVCVKLSDGGKLSWQRWAKTKHKQNMKKTHLRAIATCITCMHMHAEHVIHTVSCNVYMRMAKEQTLAAWAVYSSISLLSPQPASSALLKIWALV